MDFNTGSSGAGGPPPPPSQSGVSSGNSSGEFNLSDPVGSFISTVRGVVLDPVGFFRGMQKGGDFLNPLVFFAACALVAGVIAGVLLFFFSLLVGDFLGALGQLFLQPIGYVVGGVVGLFIGAGILHVLAMLLVKPNAGFEATYRVGAYLGALYLVSWLAIIPILGWLLIVPLSIWYVVLAVLGIREAHSTTTGRAAAVVLIPVGVFFLFGLLIIGIIGAAVFFGAQQGV